MQYLLFIFALITASSVDEVSGIRSSARSRHGKNRPVSKVIVLLRDMQGQLEKDALADEETYKKMACWCSQNEKATAQAVAAEEMRISKLSSRHQAKTAEVTGLRAEQNNLESEVNRDQQALATATALRQKQLSAFRSEERDLVQSIQALKAAIVVLSKHHTPSLVQLSHQHTRKIADALEGAMKHHGEILDGLLTSQQKQMAMAFMAGLKSHMDSQPGAKSGQIFGVLQQMLENFQQHLAAAQKQESSDQQAFSELERAQQAQITAGRTQLDTKSQVVAAEQDRDAQYLADRQNTQRSLEADRAFLTNLREQCLVADREWDVRQRTRAQELQAITKAIQMLSSDDAHDLFARTFNPAFVQTSSFAAHVSQKRERASSLLDAVAKRVQNPRLAMLASRVKLDAFTRVKQAIDALVTQLLREKRDEIDHKDFCISEFADNQRQNQSKYNNKRDTQSQVDDALLTAQTLANDLNTLQTQISSAQAELKRAGEDREQENQAFQVTVRDQRETVRLLQAAHSVLTDFYGGSTGPSLLQGQQVPGGSGQVETSSPPDGFQAYKKQTSSHGVLTLILTIIQDAQAVEAAAIRSEGDAQRAYEDFVRQTNTVINAKSRELVEKTEAKAQKEKDIVELNKDNAALALQLEQLANSNAQLHSSCDFIMANFDARQAARDDEVEGLRQAKAILSGANFQSSLQTL